jgi:hypothetical protein
MMLKVRQIGQWSDSVAIGLVIDHKNELMVNYKMLHKLSAREEDNCNRDFKRDIRKIKAIPDVDYFIIDSYDKKIYLKPKTAISIIRSNRNLKRNINFSDQLIRYINGKIGVISNTQIQTNSLLPHYLVDGIHYFSCKKIREIEGKSYEGSRDFVNKVDSNDIFYLTKLEGKMAVSSAKSADDPVISSKSPNGNVYLNFDGLNRYIQSSTSECWIQYQRDTNAIIKKNFDDRWEQYTKTKEIEINPSGLSLPSITALVNLKLDELKNQILKSIMPELEDIKKDNVILSNMVEAIQGDRLAKIDGIKRKKEKPSREGYVYIVRSDPNRHSYKIGHSKNHPKDIDFARLKEYTRMNMNAYVVAYSDKIQDRFSFEKYLHVKYLQHKEYTGEGEKRNEVYVFAPNFLNKIIIEEKLIRANRFNSEGQGELFG